jgi:hypothetical protein
MGEVQLRSGPCKRLQGHVRATQVCEILSIHMFEKPLAHSQISQPTLDMKLLLLIHSRFTSKSLTIEGKR